MFCVSVWGWEIFLLSVTFYFVVFSLLPGALDRRCHMIAAILDDSCTTCCNNNRILKLAVFMLFTTYYKATLLTFHIVSQRL